MQVKLVGGSLALDQGNSDIMRPRGDEIRPQKKIHRYPDGIDSLKGRQHSVNIIIHSIMCY